MAAPPISLPRRSDVAGDHKRRGGRIAAVFPIHYPRALLRAFGILPIEVWGPPGVDPALGSAHLQPYVCSIVRNGLSFLLSGGLDIADVLVVPHACDSLQGLGSVLIDFVRPRQPVVPLYLPRASGRPGVAFLADELRLVYDRLASVTGLHPSDADLSGCIHHEEAADQVLADLHRRRALLTMTDAEFYRLIRAREYLPAESFTAAGHQALAQVGGAGRRGVPIVLSGIVPEPMTLFNTIKTLGGWVAADDLACCGRRLYPPGFHANPFFRMAESLLGASPDPTRGDPVQARLDHLVRLASASDARGVIFYGVKFCEPELFDLPTLRKGLQETGFPSISIEVDLSDPLPQQAVTRIEAFFEMIA